jgi:hypothetical protein
LAERIAAAYIARVRPHAILLTGSVAAGVSDTCSDLDLIAYYDRLPTEDQLAATRTLLSATDVRTTGDRDPQASVEEFVVQGIEC